MYSLEKFTFKTKKEMQDYVRSVVYSLGESVIKPDSPHFTLFKDIIKKENIIEFHIVKNPINEKAFHMMYRTAPVYDPSGYKLKYGSTVDFSWLKCGLDSVDNSLIKAMRNEIYEDIINFKKQCVKKCVFCDVTDSEFHVDHHEPSFKQLSDSFLEDKETNFLKYKYNKDNKLTYFDDNDFRMVVFSNQWKDYHNKNCNLQILCAKCNLTKAK
jgi:hypothetical protein